MIFFTHFYTHACINVICFYTFIHAYTVKSNIIKMSIILFGKYLFYIKLNYYIFPLLLYYTVRCIIYLHIYFNLIFIDLFMVL